MRTLRVSIIAAMSAFALVACATEESTVVIDDPLVVEVFAAADVDPSVTLAIEESLELAIEAWGLYWPTGVLGIGSRS